MFADGDVMSDVDEVIDFGARPDGRGPKRAPIDGRVGPNFDVIMNDNLAELKNLAMTSFIENVTGAIRAKDRSCVNSDTVTDAGFLIENYVGVKTNVLSELTISAQVVAAHEHRAGANARAGTGDTMGADMSGGIDFSGRGDDC